MTVNRNGGRNNCEVKRKKFEKERGKEGERRENTESNRKADKKQDRDRDSEYGGKEVDEKKVAMKSNSESEK